MSWLRSSRGTLLTLIHVENDHWIIKTLCLCIWIMWHYFLVLSIKRNSEFETQISFQVQSSLSASCESRHPMSPPKNSCSFQWQRNLAAPGLAHVWHLMVLCIVCLAFVVAVCTVQFRAAVGVTVNRTVHRSCCSQSWRVVTTAKTPSEFSSAFRSSSCWSVLNIIAFSSKL